jgi:hypothetical protein
LCSIGACRRIESVKICQDEVADDEDPLDPRFIAHLTSQVEIQIIVISRDEIGGLLGERWRLPLEFVEGMRLHHTTAQAVQNPELMTVVRFADLLAEHWMCGIGENPPGNLFDNDESFGLLSQQEPSLKARGFEEVVTQLSEKFVEQKSLEGVF